MATGIRGCVPRAAGRARYALLGVAMATALTACSAADAGDFPTRPIELVNPFPAGGSHDAHARAIASAAEAHFGQQVQVAIRSGGGGTIGADFVVNQADPDGYTMMLGDPGSTIIQPLLQDVNYSTDDLEPVAQIDESPIVFVTLPEAPWDDMADLVADAEQRPGEILYAAGPQFGNDQIAVEMLQDVAGIELRHVPTDGGGNVYRATLAGDVEVGVLFPASVENDIKDGNLKALGVTSSERIPGLEDVPTLAEQGFDVDWQMFRVVYVPAETPEDRVEMLADKFEALLGDADFEKLLVDMGEQPGFLRGEELDSKLDAARERIEGIVQ